MRGILGPRAAAGRHRRRWLARRRRLVAALLSAAIAAVAAGTVLTVVDPAPRERAEVTSAGPAPAEPPAAPASPTPPPEEPEEPVTPPPDPTPPQLGAPDPQVVRAAVQFSPLVRYHRDLPGGAYTNAGNTGGHTYVLRSPPGPVTPVWTRGCWSRSGTSSPVAMTSPPTVATRPSTNSR